MDKVELALPKQKKGYPNTKGHLLPLPYKGSSSSVLDTRSCHKHACYLLFLHTSSYSAWGLPSYLNCLIL